MDRVKKVSYFQESIFSDFLDEDWEVFGVFGGVLSGMGVDDSDEGRSLFWKEAVEGF